MNEWISIIGKCKDEKLTSERINNMDFFERCGYLNFNTVLLARQFQCGVEIFFQILSLSRVKYYNIRLEFRVRWSPHIYSFLWILYVPILIKDNIKECITFVDGIVKANVSDIKKSMRIYWQNFLNHRINIQLILSLIR